MGFYLFFFGGEGGGFMYVNDSESKFVRMCFLECCRGSSFQFPVPGKDTSASCVDVGSGSAAFLGFQQSMVQFLVMYTLNRHSQAPVCS